MKLKTIGAAALAAAVMGATSATAFAGMLPDGGLLVAPVPDSSPAADSADKESNDIAPAPGTGADNPGTGAQGVAMIIGAAALAGAAVVVSRRKK